MVMLLLGSTSMCCAMLAAYGTCASSLKTQAASWQCICCRNSCNDSLPASRLLMRTDMQPAGVLLHVACSLLQQCWAEPSQAWPVLARCPTRMQCCCVGPVQRLIYVAEFSAVKDTLHAQLQAEGQTPTDLRNETIQRLGAVESNM
jgi:hypothetical protein